MKHCLSLANTICEVKNQFFPFCFFLQLRNLLTRSILGYVDVFADHRKLPRIEMELILQGGFPIEIEFQISLLITYSLAIFRL